eukprot:7443490-Karenia_brevis.AAC.1
MHSIFQLAALASGLVLSATKSTLVPVGAERSDGTLLRIKNWLKACIPDWATFKVVHAAEYLGILLGPSADHDQFEKTKAKYDERCDDVAAAGMSALLSALAYNSKCASVFSHKIQFYDLPSSFDRQEAK